MNPVLRLSAGHELPGQQMAQMLLDLERLTTTLDVQLTDELAGFSAELRLPTQQAKCHTATTGCTGAYHAMSPTL